MSQQPPENVQSISLIWPNVQDVPVHRANQFLIQLAPGPAGTPEEVLINVGYAGPPVVLGTPEEQMAALGAIGAVAVHTLGRFSISRGRVDELIGVLQKMATMYDDNQGSKP